MRYQDDTSDLLGLGGHVDRKKFDYDEDFDFENFLKVKDMTVGFWRKIGRDPGFVKRPERGARIQRLSRVLRNELGRMMRFAGEGGNEVFLATTVCDELKKKGVLECAHLAESHVGEGFGGLPLPIREPEARLAILPRDLSVRVRDRAPPRFRLDARALAR